MTNLQDIGGAMLADAIKCADTLEQINLRDNGLGAESSDAYLFLVKEKQNLWRV